MICSISVLNNIGRQPEGKYECRVVTWEETAVIQVRSKDVNWDRDPGIREGTGGSHLKAALIL